MLISGEQLEFEPFGRRVLDKTSRDEHDEQPAIENCENNNGSRDVRSNKRIFAVRKHNELYEELYAEGCKLIWSCNNTTLLKTFSTDFPISDAFWHTFTSSSASDVPGIDTNSSRKQRWDALCIIGEKDIDIYRTSDGERFQEKLPFPIRRVYSTEAGLLLERTPTDSEKKSFKTGDDHFFPILFSISHPLNEIVPVIYKPKDSVCHDVAARYANDLTLKVVHSDRRLSLLLTYDEKKGYHSLWRIRKATKQDANSASEYLQHSLVSNVSTSTIFSQNSLLNANKLTPAMARTGPALFSFSPSVSHSIGCGPSSSSGQQPSSSLQQSSAAATTTSISSGLLSHLFAGAPSSTPEQQLFRPPIGYAPDSRSPATIARMFPSPTFALTPRMQLIRTPIAAMSTNPVGNRLMRMNTSVDMSPVSLVLTPRSINAATPKTEFCQNDFASPAMNSYHAGDYMRSSTYVQSAVPFVPDLCLEPFWNENGARTSGEVQWFVPKAQEAATRAIVVEDFAGGVYFCYLVSSQCQLRCVQMIRKDINDQCSIAPGSLSLISCRDVAVLADSKFMVILDQSNSLSLFNGTRKICSLCCDAFSLLSPPDKYSSEFYKSHASRIMSSSQALSSSEPVIQAASEAEGMDVLSPVLDDDQVDTGVMTGAVAAIHTFCECSPYFLVTLNSRRTCRCSLPITDTDPLVRLCFTSLKSVLPSDVVNELYSSWCVNRPVLSSSSSASAGCPEIMLFMKLVMEATGFPQLKVFHKFGLTDEPLNEIPAKRSKCSDDGTDSDWSYLVQSFTNAAVDNKFHLRPDGTPQTDDDGGDVSEAAAAGCDPNVRFTVAYFAHLPTIFYALHCCYEEMKLNQLYWPFLEPLGECLCIMAGALRQHLYVDHYRRDGCHLSSYDQSVAIALSADSRPLRFPPYWPPDCFNVFSHVYRLLLNGGDNNRNRRVVVVGHCERLWITCLLYRLLSGHIRHASDVHEYILTIGAQSPFQRSCLRVLENAARDSRSSDVTEVVASLLRLVEDRNTGFVEDTGGVTSARVTLWTFPPGIIAPVFLRLTPHQLRTIKLSVSIDDGASANTSNNVVSTAAKDDPTLLLQSCNEKATTKLKKEDADGMAGAFLNDELSKMLFPNDLRLLDVRNMLRSSKQTKIAIKQRPGLSDNEFREEQERYLYSVCVRTMTLPIGRGMFTLRSHRPVLAENMEIPKLCLTGRTSGPQSLTIDLSHIDVPSNMDLFAKFHNGVAAGLRLAPPDSNTSSSGDGVDGIEQQLDTSWIAYNTPRSIASSGGEVVGALTPEHAGVLFGLGLNGHLSNLALFNLHEYLVKGDSMTSSALLLGVAAAKRKSADMQSMKMLSTHLPFLLSPTLLELNIDPMVQTAAVLGVGLLYAESGNYRLAESLVREIGRPATASNDNFVDRESYALACGFALGLITLGLGDIVFGDPNFTLADELRLLMNGGHKRRHHYATDAAPSQLVKDGDYLNVHVTSAPATVALGLMYLGSNNREVASWLDPPETTVLLDTVRPDLLLVRIVGRSLILWDDILPRLDWVESHVPPVVAKFINMNEEERATAVLEQRVDLETIAQAYCNVVAGACVAVGLKFAGSANADALHCLLHFYKLFDASLQHRSSASWRKIYAKAGRYTTETALNVVVMALGSVMAGTGNLDVTRIVRHLRQRVGQNCTNWLLHGGHTAAHMALGLLYLGGGRYTLSTSNFSVAVLYCAMYPKFPIAPNDNRFHLQAFRHLYVLACEPRLLMTLDHRSSELAYCNINIKFKTSPHYDATIESLKTPCVLPELKLLEEVEIIDERYWPIRFAAPYKWDELKSLLSSRKPLEICRRAGFCTRKEDPLDHRSLAFLFRMHSEDWVPTAQPISSSEAAEIIESLKLWCSRRDCQYLYSSLVDLFQLVSRRNPRTLDVWQLKLLLAGTSPSYGSERGQAVVMRMEFLSALEFRLRQILCEGVTAASLKTYIENHGSGNWWPEDGGATLFGQFLTLFDLPTRSFWLEAGLREYRTLRLFLEKCAALNIPTNTALTIYRILMKS